jgi:hypothetical protein
MSILAATGLLANLGVAEFIVVTTGLITIGAFIWNAAEKQHRAIRKLELDIAETNARIDAVANKFRLLALTASNKQNENANGILNIENYLEATTAYRKRETRSNSGADFLRYDNIQEDLF